jgi:2-polyprenyl-3-methyl-5-hydroxy-6-metoxy-1,4-benzoquinol methylase
MNNNFDKLNIDISKLFNNLEIRKNLNHLKKPFIFKIFLRYIVALSYKIGLYERLVNSGFLLSWFYEFKEYWSKELGGRPLYFNDFYFLLGIFRQDYQLVKVEENSSEVNFLYSWQNNKTLYQLFGAVRRFSLEPFYSYKYEKWIKSNDSILEYGCGIAPLSNSLLKYSLKSNLKITIADIPQINSHFARWRLGNTVEYINLIPYKKNLKKKYDKIFLITVLEHLPDPLNVIKELRGSLNKNGLLIFDYILSEGTGLDTIEAVKQREVVLDYILHNFTVLKGNIDKSKSMGTTVIKLKDTHKAYE